ncbi:hypothetical protein KI387_035855, partial [Taxus chinensis]
MPAKIHPRIPHHSENVLIEDQFCMERVTALTVWKKSLLFNCNGFTVFHPSGNLAFRVENYRSDLNKELVLMDAAGNSLLTVTRKRLSLQNEWQAFLGDKSNGQKKPLFIVRRRSLLPTKVLAEIFVGSTKQKRHPDYKIEGSYARRSCTVYNNSGDIVFEAQRQNSKMKRKQ